MCDWGKNTDLIISFFLLFVPTRRTHKRELALQKRRKNASDTVQLYMYNCTCTLHESRLYNYVYTFGIFFLLIFIFFQQPFALNMRFNTTTFISPHLNRDIFLFSSVTLYIHLGRDSNNFVRSCKFYDLSIEGIGRRSSIAANCG